MASGALLEVNVLETMCFKFRQQIVPCQGAIHSNIRSLFWRNMDWLHHRTINRTKLLFCLAVIEHSQAAHRPNYEQFAYSLPHLGRNGLHLWTKFLPKKWILCKLIKSPTTERETILFALVLALVSPRSCRERRWGRRRMRSMWSRVIHYCKLSFKLVDSTYSKLCVRRLIIWTISCSKRTIYILCRTPIFVVKLNVDAVTSQVFPLCNAK